MTFAWIDSAPCELCGYRASGMIESDADAAHDNVCCGGSRVIGACDYIVTDGAECVSHSMLRRDASALAESNVRRGIIATAQPWHNVARVGFALAEIDALG